MAFTVLEATAVVNSAAPAATTPLMTAVLAVVAVIAAASVAVPIPLNQR